MKLEIKNHSIFVQVLVVFILSAFAFISSVFADWNPPTQSPPGDNVISPLNISNIAQSKIGGLLLNTGGAPNGLIVQSGKVGIGTTNPQATLDVKGTIKITPASSSSSGAGRAACWTDQNLLGYCLVNMYGGMCTNCQVQ
ncbi:MAG: cohesin domain-containing protein [bacterium]|nr:cohesin domain-containing protein [bacterium]